MNKVMVAAIMRDEANNIEDWYISVQHADRIVVVDTGSSDRSVELAKYYESIHPDFTVIEMLPKDFEGPVSYDVARTVACASADSRTICMWLDLDERFVSDSNNWVTEIHNLPEHIDLVQVKMDLVGDGSIVYEQAKGFRGGTHFWKYAVHEILTPVSGVSLPYKAATFNTIHLQEPNKEYRAFHLDLLRMDHTRYQYDPRVLFYLTRQHAYRLSDLIENPDVADADIMAYYQQQVSRCFGLLREIAPHSDYCTWAALEIARSCEAYTAIAPEGVLHALIAHTIRPDRVETFGQVCRSYFYANEDLSCVAYGIRGMEHTMPVDSNFMFDYSNRYLAEMPPFIVQSLLNVGLVDKAHLYAHKYNRTDLLPQPVGQ